MKELPEYRRLKYFVEENLSGFLPGIDGKSKILEESILYSLNSGGKRIRPVLLLAACEIAGGDTEQALPYAAAIEFIHSYSLIHDDLPAMDDDDFRRGIASNHKVYGEAVAILAGDGLLTSAFEVMNFDLLMHLDDTKKLNRRIRAMYEICKGAGVGGMVGGQTADITSSETAMSKEELDYIHLNKTAALIRASLLAGAHIGGAGNDLIDALGVYGEKFGLAFQIADDLLDLTTEDVAPGSENRNPNYASLDGIDFAKRRLEELIAEAVAAFGALHDIPNPDFLIETARSLTNTAS